MKKLLFILLLFAASGAGAQHINGIKITGQNFFNASDSAYVNTLWCAYRTSYDGTYEQVQLIPYYSPTAAVTKSTPSLDGAKWNLPNLTFTWASAAYPTLIIVEDSIISKTAANGLTATTF